MAEMRTLVKFILVAIAGAFLPVPEATAEDVVFIYRVSLKCTAQGQVQTGVVDSLLGPAYNEKAKATIRGYAVCDANYDITYVWFDSKRKVYHLTDDHYFDTASFDKSGKKTVHRDGASWARKGTHNGYTATVGLLTTIEGANSNRKPSIKFSYRLDNDERHQRFYYFPRVQRVVSNGQLMLTSKVPLDVFLLNWGGQEANVVEGFGIWELACQGTWRLDSSYSSYSNDPRDPDEGPTPPPVGTMERGVHEVTKRLEDRYDYSETSEDISPASFFFPKFITVNESIDHNINF